MRLLRCCVLLSACARSPATSDPVKESAPSENETPLISHVLARPGESVAIHQIGQETTRLRLLAGLEDGEPFITLVANDTRLVLRVRERDHDGFLLVRTNRGDHLVHQRQGGGPGTCVWFAEADVYPPWHWQLDEAHDLDASPTRTMATGGYLDCADGFKACGCGTWRSNLQLRTKGPRAESIELVAAPYAESVNGAVAPLGPPQILPL